MLWFSYRQQSRAFLLSSVLHAAATQVNPTNNDSPPNMAVFLRRRCCPPPSRRYPKHHDDSQYAFTLPWLSKLGSGSGSSSSLMDGYPVVMTLLALASLFFLWRAALLDPGIIVRAPVRRMSGTADHSSLPPGWTRHFDKKEGQPYFYNEAQATTTWEIPK